MSLNVTEKSPGPVFTRRDAGESLSILAGVLSAILLVSGCAGFQGIKNKTPAPSEPPTSLDSPSKVSVTGTGPAPGGSVVSNEEKPPAHNVSNSVIQDSGSAVSPATDSPSSTDALRGNPTDPGRAAVPDDKVTRLSQPEPSEIILNPNRAETERDDIPHSAEAEKISPAGYQENGAASFDNKDIPSGYNNGQAAHSPETAAFQNVSRLKEASADAPSSPNGPASSNESASPSGAAASSSESASPSNAAASSPSAAGESREIPIGTRGDSPAKPSNRVKYRTVIEEE